MPKTSGRSSFFFSNKKRFFCSRFLQQNWSKQMKTNDDNLCPWIINEHLPYPIGGRTSIDGYLFYENVFETTSSLQIYSYGSSNLLFQGLMNSTFKLVRMSSMTCRVSTKSKCLLFEYIRECL